MADPLDAVWRVYIRNYDGSILDELDNWISLTIRMVFNSHGTWTLEMANDGVSARLMNESRGIVITRNDITVFSGRVMTEFTRTGTTITCGGVSDDYLLWAPALPDPAHPLAPTTAYDVVTGAASTVMQTLVRRNIGDLATVERRATGLVFAADPALGSTLTGRGSGQRLVSVLRELAATEIAGGLGFHVIQTAFDGTRTFRVYQPTDRSADIKFGLELGTVTDFADTKAAPEYTYVYVQGGDGLGANNRTIVGDGDSLAMATWGRIEGIIVEQDVTDPGELNQKLAEALAGIQTSRTVKVSPIEVESQQFVDNWFLGDLVSFQVATGPTTTETFTDLIREVLIDMTPDRGVIVTPLIGDAAASTDNVYAQHIASVSARIGNIERNWTVPDRSVIPDMLADNAVITRTIAADAVTAPKLDSAETPANHEVLGYETSSGRMVWLAASEVTGYGTFANLTVTGNTTLGDNAAVDGLAINAQVISNGILFQKALLQVANASSTVVASFDPTAGSANVRLGPFAAPLVYVDVPNSRTIVGGTLTPLASAPDDKFTVVGGTSYFAGNSGPSIGLRYNAAQAVGWTVGVSAAGANPSLWFRDDGNVVQLALNDASAAYQVEVANNLYVFGVAAIASAVSANKAVLNGTTFVGPEILRVISGSSLLEGKVTVTTGGVDISGGLTINNTGIDVTGGILLQSSGNIDGNGGTAGQLRIGAVIVNNTSLSSTEKLRVSGATRLEGAVDVTTGSVTVAGGISAGASSTFTGGVTLTNSILTLTGGQVAFPSTQVASADPDTLDDYKERNWTPSTGAASYTTQVGRYTKIGRLIVFQGEIQINSATGTSVSTITGLPFSAATSSAISVGYFSGSATNYVFLTGYISGTTITLYALNGTAAAGLGTATFFQATARIVFQGSYII